MRIINAVDSLGEIVKIYGGANEDVTMSVIVMDRDGPDA